MNEQIVVTIKDGTVKVATSGFAGPACQDATKALSKALGTQISDTPTEEMFTPSTTTTPQVGR